MKSEETTHTRVYLSLPINGYDIGERYFAALAKQEFLESRGFEVFNPLRNGLPTDASEDLHMRKDICELTKCDAVLFMSGFINSKGCKTEFDVATACGINVYFEESFNINSLKVV